MTVLGFQVALDPYLPQNLVGGSVPYIEGMEEEAVWNAAAQACATEKVHFSYTVEDGRCWYIACPSASLSSNPGSWCPLAAALPGNSEYWDKETVYLYEQEGEAAALRWDKETRRLQVFLGASRTLLPRMQSMDSNFVTVNPDVVKPVPWINRMLKTEQLSRFAAQTLLLTGILLNVVMLSFLAFQFVASNAVERDLQVAIDETDRASQQLMVEAQGVMKSDTIKHMARIQEILDDLRVVEGTLVKYEVQNDAVKWEAILPQSYADDRNIASLKDLQIEPLKDQPDMDTHVRVVGHK